MAYGYFSLLLHLTIIIVTIYCQNSAAAEREHPVDIAAHVSVQPLWDIDDNNTSPCEITQSNTTSGAIVDVHGSPHRTCSIQVNTRVEYHAQITIQGNEFLQDSIVMYIERQGDLVDCPNKYLVFKGQAEACSANLLHDFQCSLQGNVSLSVSGISASSSLTVCPEANHTFSENGNTANRTTNTCKTVKGFRYKITCDPYYYDGTCRLNFLSTCNATFHHREIKFHCIDIGFTKDEEALVMYPKNIPILDLSYNFIIELEGNAFHDLAKLQELRLQGNYLTTLPDELFQQLQDLKVLSLFRNQLVTLAANLFQRLSQLTNLLLDYNNLRQVPSILFNRLVNLKVLWLDNNKLETLHPHSFLGLSQVTELSLGMNRFITLPGRLFLDMEHLYYLYLYSNKLKTVPHDLFWGLRSVHYLYLNFNQLSTLPSNLFQDLGNLRVLFLDYNELNTLPSNVFDGLGQLKTLKLGANNLTTLPENLFWQLRNVEQIALWGNQLETLPALTFKNLTKMGHLAIHANKVTTLPEQLFSALQDVYLIAISDNQIVSLNAGMFQGLTKLGYLALHMNRLTTIPAGLFAGLESLYIVTLYNNELVTLDSQLFHNLDNLQTFMIDVNKLEILPGDVFRGLKKLNYISLPRNQLERLDVDTFRGLYNLQILYLANNKIIKLDNTIFQDVVNITFIDLANNRLKECPDIKHLMYLRYFNIRDNIMTGVNHDTFSNDNKKLELAVSQHEICECYAPTGVECSAGDNRSPYLTCDRLLSDKVLVVLMWLIGINALVGNFYVLVWRKKNTKRYKVQNLLLSNLALSDSLMGIYMLMIGCADFYYGDYFPMQSETWRSGITCRIAGALSITSSEASVFFVTLISIDRFISIKFPYSVKKLGKYSTIVCAGLIWILSLALGIVPSILAGENFKFYDISHVCIGLPLALTKTYSTKQNTTLLYIENTDFANDKNVYTTEFTGLVNGLYFSSALFLGVNGICYLLIFGCYIEIFRAVRRSAKTSGRTPDADEQMKLTRKVTAIVATDFLCWAPVIIMGILVQTRVTELPPSVYAWSVTFVLPLNSAINPYLYTIAEIVTNYQKKRATKRKPQTIVMEQSSTQAI